MALSAKPREFHGEAADGSSRTAGSSRVSPAAETIRTGSTMSFKKAAGAEIHRWEPTCIFEMGSSHKLWLSVFRSRFHETITKNQEREQKTNNQEQFTV